ncbi:MAG: hypothetical protein GKR88_04300 [Flavobacteriaceae bacterium]|nr:MAG: hypothetical protein GKR88_04300 [Flavobacteriaceae bacterium]
MMKYKILLLVFVLASCETETPKTEAYTILYDVTDPLIATPNVREIKDFANATNTDKTLLIRYLEISDVDFNPVSELVRKASKGGLLSNAVNEKQEADRFQNNLIQLLTRKDSIIPSSHSSIFGPIISEVKILASLPEKTNKRIIVYSDLMENSNWLSFYRTRDVLLLQRHPEKLIKSYLQKAEGLENISKLSVHIVFIPKNNAENERYLRLQEVYTTVFDSLKIPISFSANLTKAQDDL